MSYPPVRYWPIYKGKKPTLVSSICFAPLSHGAMPEAVRFMAYSSPKIRDGSPLTQEAIDFWLDFTKRMFRRPECPKFTMRKLKESRVIYRLETKGLSYKQGLLYLTWFRYPQEFPDIVAELFKRKVDGDTDEILFLKLQQIHDEVVMGKFKLMYDSIGGHGLMYRYPAWNSKPEDLKPITIERFVHNIKNPPTTVQAYFL